MIKWSYYVEIKEMTYYIICSFHTSTLKESLDLPLYVHLSIHPSEKFNFMKKVENVASEPYMYEHISG